MISLLLFISCNSSFEKATSIAINGNDKYGEEYKEAESLANFYFMEYFNSYAINDNLLDSSLKYYNLLISYDSTNYINHLNIINILEYRQLYDSIVSYIKLFPDEYDNLSLKKHMELRYRAIKCMKEGDTIGYNKYLDEILILLRTEFKKNEHFCDSFMIYGYEDCLYNEDCNIKISFYTMYYEMLRFRYGVDTIEKIFQEKKKAYYWSDETYNEIFKCVSSNQTFSINIYS
jgi:hypothetical protein